jgi:hypothetical protein
MPLRLLIRQAGMAGYLLLAHRPLGLAIFRQRTQGYDTIDDSAIIQILYTCICFGYSAWYLRLPRNRDAWDILVSNPVVFFLSFVFLCLMSALWSPNPPYTAFMAFQCLAFLMLIVAAMQEVYRRSSPQDLIEWTIMWVVWNIFWSVVIYVRSSRLLLLGTLFEAAGLFTGVPFFIAIYLCRRRVFGWIIAAFAILSVSNTNYFGILPGLLLGAVLGDRKSKMLALAVASVAVAAVLLVGGENVIQNTLFYGQGGVGWEYTTGRDKLWTMGWELCMEQPLWGYGFVVGERDILMQARGASVISMHSMLLSAFLGVGFLGPVFLVLYFWGTWALCLRRGIPPAWRFAFAATTLMVCIVSMAGPGLGGRVYGSWLASMAVMTMIAVLCKNGACVRTVWECPITTGPPLGSPFRR